MKSDEYMRGFAEALVLVSELFETHRETFSRHRALSRGGSRFVIAVLDACIKSRYALSEIGSRRMNVFLYKDRHVELVPKDIDQQPKETK